MMNPHERLAAHGMDALDGVKALIELMAGWRAEFERNGYTADEARRLAVAMLAGRPAEDEQQDRS